MKKICLSMIIVLLLIPISVNAATTPRIITLDANTTGMTISYNGTIEDGSHAVMCKLLNNNSEELDLLSSPVEDNKFEGTFTVNDKGNYKVACANYEGGDIKEVDATITTVNTKTATNTKTGDNIIPFILIALISIIGIITTIVINKKKILKVR